MNILLTNDDGYQSAGLILLAQSLVSAGHQVYVVAPDGQRSAFSHSVNFHKNLVVEKLNDYCGAKEAYICSGTPADCVKFAASMLDVEFDLLISGPNNGENYGVCILYSGTVAAAEEGAICGIKSIALSRCGFGGSFAPTVEYLVNNLDKLYDCCYVGGVINVNVPDLPLSQIKGVKVVPQSTKSLFDDYFVKKEEPNVYIITGDQLPIEDEVSDVTEIRNGYISITPLHVDRTDFAKIAAVEAELGK